VSVTALAGSTVAVLGMGALGRTLVGALANAGATVIAVDRSQTTAEIALQEGAASGSGYGVDLSDDTAVQEWLTQVHSRHGRLDGVIHAVGGWKGSREFGPESLKHADELYDPLLRTLQVTTAFAASDLASSPRGFFIMVSSTAVTQPTAGNAAYVSLKAAAEGWTLSLAHSFVGSNASATVLRIKALLTDQMRQEHPERTFPGYSTPTEVAEIILQIATAVPEEVTGRIVQLPAEEKSQ
jgi:NAD(P)-dependent dehydrogenase (short-subunit alcohol dehydrogenase family)